MKTRVIKTERVQKMVIKEIVSRLQYVADISAMLCNIAGLDCAKAFKNSVAYIQGWSRKLMDDNMAIVWAAARAEKAARYIQGEQ